MAHGPAGVAHYREGTHDHAFQWELGTGRVVIIIYIPSPDEWDARLPWAAGRRAEVLDALAREMRRRHCPTCGIEITERWINLTEWPVLGRNAFAALWRRVRRWLGGGRAGAPSREK